MKQTLKKKGYQRKHYEKLKTLGLCVSCREPAADGRIRCLMCIKIRKAWYSAAKMKKWRDSRPLEKQLETLYKQYKDNAKARNIIFDFPFEKFSLLACLICFHCGKPPEENRGNGVDRLDNNLGYIEGNCVSCCAQCNYSKRNQTTDEFYEHARRLVSFQDSTKVL